MKDKIITPNNNLLVNLRDSKKSCLYNVEMMNAPKIESIIYEINAP